MINDDNDLIVANRYCAMWCRLECTNQSVVPQGGCAQGVASGDWKL
jgi:hypothetical protein